MSDSAETSYIEFSDACRVRNKKLMGMKNIKGDAAVRNSFPTLRATTRMCRPEEYSMCYAVYAVGLYVDPKAAKKALDGKVTAGSAAPDQAIFDGRSPAAFSQL